MWWNCANTEPATVPKSCPTTTAGMVIVCPGIVGSTVRQSGCPASLQGHTRYGADEMRDRPLCCDMSVFIFIFSMNVYAVNIARIHKIAG